MCGINGIFLYGGDVAVDLAELRRTRDHMAPRGPDGFGEWVSDDRRVALGHRRLAIIDQTQGGAQPMASADGRLVVTFNGEIYNYRELRRGLEAEGCIFRSDSDTEVLLQLYARRGIAMLTELRGMFAFAIWDAAKCELVMARDPYGIKPLYYSNDGQALRFASSVKALLRGGAISQQHDPAGCVGFFLFGSVPEPYTVVRAIRSLPAGAFLVCGRGPRNEPQTYCSIPRLIVESAHRKSTIAAGDIQQVFSAAVLDSVRHHLVADVPVGAFLSSGVDSGALVGLMRDAGQSEIMLTSRRMVQLDHSSELRL